MGKEMTGISQLASMKDPNDIRKQSSLLLFQKTVWIEPGGGAGGSRRGDGKVQSFPPIWPTMRYFQITVL